MDNLSFKQVTTYLDHADTDLQFILTKITQLENLKRKIELYFNPSLKAQCVIANIKENKLIILTTSGAIATQVRYQTSDLLAKFKQDEALSHIYAIECKVSPQLIQSTDKSAADEGHKIAFLSKETAQMIQNMAQTIADPKLKAIMERIATHTKET